jgi:hypothetical protein
VTDAVALAWARSVDGLRKTNWRAIAIAVALGAAGGVVFSQLRLPLAWMLGPMVAVTIAATAGAKVAIPAPLRTVCNGMLGLLLGSTFTPDIFGRVAEWSLTLGVLIAYVMLIAATIVLIFRRVFGFDPVTAYFSAMPGGIVEMTVIGSAMGGDGRTIALFHGARVLVVAIAVPMGFRFLAGYEPQSIAALAGAAAPMGPMDAVILAVGGIVGYFVTARCRIPAPAMMGPLIASGLAHLTGVTDASLPTLLIIIGQLGVGASIGCRFSGTRPAVILRTLGLATITVLVMLALSLVFAVALGRITGLPPGELVLAYAPGGITEMCLVAYILGFDVAFVATHHVVRFVFVIIAAPILSRFMGAGRRNAAA